MGRTADKGKAAAADEEAPVAAAVAAAPMEVDGSGAAPAAALAPSFGLSSRSDFKRAASVPLGFTCLMTNQVSGERERAMRVRKRGRAARPRLGARLMGRQKVAQSPPIFAPLQMRAGCRGGGATMVTCTCRADDSPHVPAGRWGLN